VASTPKASPPPVPAEGALGWWKPGVGKFIVYQHGGKRLNLVDGFYEVHKLQTELLFQFKQVGAHLIPVLLVILWGFLGPPRNHMPHPPEVEVLAAHGAGGAALGLNPPLFDTRHTDIVAAHQLACLVAVVAVTDWTLHLTI